MAPASRNDIFIPGRRSANLERYQVRYVVVEAEGTFMGMRPAYFPALVDYIQARIESRRSFGSFDLIELRQQSRGPGAPSA